MTYSIALLNLYFFVFESDNVELFNWAERNYPTETMKDFIEILSTCLKVVRKNILTYLRNSYQYDCHVGDMFRKLAFIEKCIDYSKFKTFYEIMPNSRSVALTFAKAHMEMAMNSKRKDADQLVFPIIDFFIAGNKSSECLSVISYFGRLRHLQYLVANQAQPERWMLSRKEFEVTISPIIHYGKVDMFKFLFENKIIDASVYDIGVLASAMNIAFQSYADYFFLELLYKEDTHMWPLTEDDILRLLRFTKFCQLRLVHRRSRILWIAHRSFGYNNIQEEPDLQVVRDEMHKKWMLFAKHTIDKQLLDRDTLMLICSYI